jgi:hypothetical protein
VILYVLQGIMSTVAMVPENPFHLINKDGSEQVVIDGEGIGQEGEQQEIEGTVR